MLQKTFFPPIWLLPVFRCARWLFMTAVAVPVMAMVIGMAILSGFSLDKTVGVAILIAKAQPLELSETTRQAFDRPADAARIRAMDHDEDAAIEAGKPIAEILWKIYFVLAALSFCVSFAVGSPTMTSNHTNQNNVAQAADGEIHAAFERRYAVDAEDPANVIELGHFADGRRACLDRPRGAVAAPYDETLRLAGVIADKIEDGTLFQAGIFSRRELADKVRAVVQLAQQGVPMQRVSFATPARPIEPGLTDD